MINSSSFIFYRLKVKDWSFSKLDLPSKENLIFNIVFFPHLQGKSELNFATYSPVVKMTILFPCRNEMQILFQPWYILEERTNLDSFYTHGSKTWAHGEFHTWKDFKVFIHMVECLPACPLVHTLFPWDEQHLLYVIYYTAIPQLPPYLAAKNVYYC